MTSVSELSGMRVTVMGLGLHGGGVAAASFCARHGAEVTVTDLKDELSLSTSVAGLADYPGIRFVLGRHDEADFATSDMVIKNPAVPRTSRYLALARRIETDISLYLSLSSAEVIGVTGTKGKSTTASAVSHLLRHRGARLGGNITVSPLTFLDDESTDEVGQAPTVLELSSFQLGDLLLTDIDALGTWPAVGVLTSFMRDHQNYYHSMNAYLQDKTQLFRFQSDDDWMVLDPQASYSDAFLAARKGRLLPVTRRNTGSGGPRVYLKEDGEGVVFDGRGTHALLPAELPLSGEHNRMNLLYAAAVAWTCGVPAESVSRTIRTFPGVPHRMEVLGERGSLTFVNDSAATVPEAALAAVRSYSVPVHLVCGGTDKDLEFGLFAAVAAETDGIYLLSGTATGEIRAILDSAHAPYCGPFDSLREAVVVATRNAKPGSVVLLSPGCASFGMFRNEFDRGNQFREIFASL